MQLAKWINTGMAMIGAHRPFILYHKPTERCDCHCRFCDVWIRQPKENDVLPTPQVISLLDQAEAAGFAMYTVWGGEPLIVDDLPAWLRHASNLGLRTVICTSGSRLEQRANEIGPLLDRLLLSLEGIGNRHDQLRGIPGLFDRVVSGLSKIRAKSRGRITLWCNLNRKNRDQVFDIANFAQDQKITVEFFPATTIAGYNEDLVLVPHERQEVFAELIDLKRRLFPILNTAYSLRLMQSGRHFQCHIPQLSIHVNAQGNIFACDPKMLPALHSLGRIDQPGLEHLWRSPGYQQQGKNLQHCNRCLLPCVAQMADGLTMQGIRKFFNWTFYQWIHPRFLFFRKNA